MSRQGVPAGRARRVFHNITIGVMCYESFHIYKAEYLNVRSESKGLFSLTLRLFRASGFEPPQPGADGAVCKGSSDNVTGGLVRRL